MDWWQRFGEMSGADEGQHSVLVFIQCSWSDGTQDHRCKVSQQDDKSAGRNRLGSTRHWYSDAWCCDQLQLPGKTQIVYTSRRSVSSNSVALIVHTSCRVLHINLQKSRYNEIRRPWLRARNEILAAWRVSFHICNQVWNETERMRLQKVNLMSTASILGFVHTIEPHHHFS